MRIFLALPLAAAFENELAAALAKAQNLMEGVKWADPQTIHATFHFFGETTPGQLQQIKFLVEPLTRRAAPLQTALKGIGFFPNAQAPRIVWGDMMNPDQRLVPLQQAIEKELELAGFECEKRPFKPHATIGRVKGKFRCAEGLELVLPETSVRAIDRLVIYKSQSDAAGSHYEIIESFPLAG